MNEQDVNAHWEFIRALMLKCGVEPTQREEFLYKEALKHGIKHGSAKK